MYDATFKPSDAAQAPVSEAGRQVHSLIRQAFGAFATWQERARQRQHLATLDDRLLKDIGLSRVDVARETSKAFWEK